MGLEIMVIGADILEMPVLHAEALGDRAELGEAETFVEMPRVDVRGDDGVELQDAKAVRLALRETVGDERLTEVQSACRALDGIARVADMAAAALVVGMQNVKAEHLAVHLGDGGIGLLCKKFCAGLLVQKMLLRESNAILDDLVPDSDQIRKIGPHDLTLPSGLRYRGLRHVEKSDKAA